MIVVDTILKYALAGTTVAGLAWGAYETWLVVPDIEAERDKAQNTLSDYTRDHNRMVLENKLANEKRGRENAEFEAQTSAVIAGLLQKGMKDEAALRAASARVADARLQLDDAKTRYLAAVANAATADPATACQRHAAAARLLGQLHSESDGVAGEAAQAADAAAGQVIRLQAYITSVCLKPLPGTAPSQP